MPDQGVLVPEPHRAVRTGEVLLGLVDLGLVGRETKPGINKSAGINSAKAGGFEMSIKAIRTRRGGNG